MIEFFKKIIEYFDRHNIPYMLSGSIAMGIYIVPRATRDIDFVVSLQQDNVDALVEYFKDDYYCSETAIKDALVHRSMFNIIDHTSGYKADFVILKNEEYRLTEFQRRQKAVFCGINIFVVSAEDLLISKMIWVQDWQSAMQMEDIKNLLELSDLDFDYIKRWIDRLKLNTFGLVSI